MFARGARTIGRFAVLAMTMVGLCRHAAADGPLSAADEAPQILDLGWKGSASFDEARQHYESGKAIAPGDVRLPYAMALVAIRNHESKLAGEYLTEALAGGKPVLPIRRAKIWLDVSQRNKEAAANDLDELVQKLAAADASQADTLETAQWLGRMIGFLGGPGQAQISQVDFEKLTAEIADKLKGTLGDAVQAGIKQSADQYAQFQQQMIQAGQDAKQRNEKKLADSREQNSAALEDASKKRSSAQEVYNKLQETYQKEATAKQNQLDADQREFNRLNSVINLLQAEYQNALYVQQQSNQAPMQNSINNNYINQLNNQLNQATSSQKKLDDEAKDIKAWFRRMDTESRTASRELKKYQTLEDGLTRKASDLQKATATGNDASTAALESRMNSLNTYAGLDLEQEKRLILRTYRK